LPDTVPKGTPDRMSFVLNKMASLLATLVVASIVLFCTSAAQAHGNHSPALSTSVEVAADIIEVEAASDVGSDADTQAVTTEKDDEAGGNRVPGSSCCGTGMSNCMAAAVSTALELLQSPPLGNHGPARQAAQLLGTVVDGLIRPPRLLV
jgi:hypothetical protein